MKGKRDENRKQAAVLRFAFKVGKTQKPRLHVFAFDGNITPRCILELKERFWPKVAIFPTINA